MYKFLFLVLVTCFLIGCSTTNSFVGGRPVFKNDIPKSKDIDWNDVIAKVINDRIEEKKKECPENLTEEKCEQKARIYVECEVWSEILGAKFEIVDAWYEDSSMWVTIKRGGNAPLVGNIEVGKLDNIQDIYMSGGKINIVYKSQARVNYEQKLFWGGSGFLGGVGFLLLIILAL